MISLWCFKKKKKIICLFFRDCSSAICRRSGEPDISHPRWYPWLLRLQWPIPTAGCWAVCLSDWPTCHATLLVAGFSLVQVWLLQYQTPDGSYWKEQSCQDTLREFAWLTCKFACVCAVCLLFVCLAFFSFVFFHAFKFLFYLTTKLKVLKVKVSPWLCDLICLALSVISSSEIMNCFK